MLPASSGSYGIKWVFGGSSQDLYVVRTTPISKPWSSAIWKGINHGYKSWDDPPSIRWFSRFTNTHCFLCGNFGLLVVNLPPLSGKKRFWNRETQRKHVNLQLWLLLALQKFYVFFIIWGCLFLFVCFFPLGFFSKYLKVVSCECSPDEGTDVRFSLRGCGHARACSFGLKCSRATSYLPLKGRTWMSRGKLGSMVSKREITHL